MFTHPLTELDLYWIGYFRADGCISRNGKYKNAQFTQNNPYPVEEFAKYIGKENKVRKCYRSTDFGDGYYWSISSSKIAYLLDELGAKTILNPEIYKSLDFWRGLLDGDGSILKRTHGGNCPIVRWNGSEEDMRQIANLIGTESRPYHTIFRTQISGRKAHSLLTELYLDKYSANQVKRDKALEMINEPFQ